MKRVFAAVLAAARVVGSTSGFARGGVGHGGGFAGDGGFARNPTTLLGSPAPQTPLSKTGFRLHSQRLRSHLPSTARRREVPTAGLCKLYLVFGLAKSGELFHRKLARARVACDQAQLVPERSRNARYERVMLVDNWR
jgi:hypothetical protein